MNKHIAIGLVCVLAFCLPVYGQDNKAADAANAASCPMMGGGMQHEMSAMSMDMGAMMKGVTDPALKANMQKMHDRMVAMSAQMGRGAGAGMGRMMHPQSSPAAPTKKSP